MARAALGRLQGRLHTGPVGLGRRRGRTEPALDRRALLRLGRRDPFGDAAAVPAPPARVRGLLRRVARERRRSRPGRRARSRRRPQPAPRRPETRSVADACRHRLRPPRLRSRPGRAARPLRPDHRGHSRLGVHEPGDRPLGRRRALPVRLRQRAALRQDADRGHGLGQADRDVWPASASASCAARARPRSPSSASAPGGCCQLLAVWSTMRAFDIHEGFPPPGSCCC